MTAPISFEDQTVVVTGAGAGLGRAYALEIARRGAAVVVNDAGVAIDGSGGSVSPAQSVVDEIVAAGGSAVASTASVADRIACGDLIEMARDSFGGRIDAVIHSAGILRNSDLLHMSEQDRDDVLRVHLLGAFDLTQLAMAVMIEQRYGRFVFTSSASGLFGRAMGANYAMAKAGVIGLCNAVAIEGEPFGVFANAILPVATTRLVRPPADDDTTELGRALRWLEQSPRGDPSWVVPLVVYLASDRCDRTHRWYSAAQGRYAEVAAGVAPGWVEDRDVPPSAERLVEHLSAIESIPSDRIEWYRSTAEELMSVMKRVG